ncbi:DUF1643 domain-containing protein [Jiella avicenniae]|uniref:DUF1643 domain-containing protein n=1 Tax=Jiella avicenniae TaxID=2907202 RepID=A0A9X1P2N4_9HYPH|nr:DUF1643 domain-containing protein [Jiella avicenniae]MCE7028639.1 DUF1643 domain-containing protein [Jiella avicenniae]
MQSVERVLRSPEMRRGNGPDRGIVSDYRLNDIARWKRIRQWSRLDDPKAVLVPWVSLNPAGNTISHQLQPFKKRGVGWNMISLSWRWGFDGCIAYNVFPIENGNPKILEDWVSSASQDLILESYAKIAADISRFDAAITSWGRNRHARRFAQILLECIRIARSESSSSLGLWRIGVNADGSPRHPGQGTRHDWLPERYDTI